MKEIRFELKIKLDEEVAKNQRLITEKQRISDLLLKSESELNEFKKTWDYRDIKHMLDDMKYYFTNIESLASQ